MPKRLVLLLSLLFGTGCYSYSEAAIEDVAPGTPVRLRVTGAEADRLAELRMSDDREVPGTLLRRENGAILLDTPIAAADATSRAGRLTQRVEIPVSQVQDVEVRRLDRLRTGALVGAVAAAAVFIVMEGFGSGNANDDRPPIENPEMRRGPAVQIRVPIGF
ncbi:MAG TPA: hypothetical protein VFU06_13130 [Longimicrobiales bacterium]|nr:hypothetical protein [Longimicrobiales bacterium]